MIKIAHEAPKSIFKEVQGKTDYDYFLVHLFEEDPEYLELARESVRSGRETILDNSIFELGEAFNMQKFADWVNKLVPTYYIVPDVLDDYLGTMENMEKWCKYYKDTINPKCKMIGVVQGTTYEEIKACYMYMDQVADADKIAFPFDSQYFNKVIPHPNKLVSWMLGRIKLLSDFNTSGIINVDKPHHLLGAGLVEEFKFYNPVEFSWIDSVDTSSPVVHGMHDILYDQTAGNHSKVSTKLYTLINSDIDERSKEIVMYNIDIFRKFCNEDWYGKRN